MLGGSDEQGADYGLGPDEEEEPAGNRNGLGPDEEDATAEPLKRAEDQKGPERARKVPGKSEPVPAEIRAQTLDGAEDLTPVPAEIRAQTLDGAEDQQGPGPGPDGSATGSGQASRSETRGRSATKDGGGVWSTEGFGSCLDAPIPSVYTE